MPVSGKSIRWRSCPKTSSAGSMAATPLGFQTRRKLHKWRQVRIEDAKAGSTHLRRRLREAATSTGLSLAWTTGANTRCMKSGCTVANGTSSSFPLPAERIPAADHRLRRFCAERAGQAGVRLRDVNGAFGKGLLRGRRPEAEFVFRHLVDDLVHRSLQIGPVFQ